MLIYLIGYMGSGKTTVGKKLANLMNYQFIDLDQLIEETYNYTIPDIFSQFDEKAFRLLEQKTLHKTFNFSNTIISTGGGAPCFFDNMSEMNLSGITVYLAMSSKSLCDRLTSAKRKRPLIQNKSKKELFRFVNQQLLSREPFYQKAKIIYEGINIDIVKLKKKIDQFN